jgi:triosephosphate isomerase (TIM)
MSERKLVFAANWKMNLGPAEAREFAKKFLALASPVEGRSLWFYPPVVSLPALSQAMQGRSDVRVGAQNAHWELKGAFTGEVSIPMVMEAGARIMLAGHSERRHLFGETDDQVAKKTRAALAAGITPMVCVGETLAERDGGRTEQVIVRQLGAVLAILEPSDWSRVVLAYEPVWAIGTGKTATSKQAEEAHVFIRQRISGHDAAIAGKVTILYGGSVKGSNAAELFAMPNVDGGLVGGASLVKEEFVAIWRAAVATGGPH